MPDPAFAASAAERFPQPRCNTGPVGELKLGIKGSQAFLPLKVNGQTLNLLLDTGDFVTSLTRDSVHRLALPPSGQPGLQMTGIGGSYEAEVVKAETVGYLNNQVNDVSLAVLPGSEFGDDEGIDGLFGANFLSAYGVELDFPGKIVRFFASERGCRHALPSWTSAAVMLPATDAGHQLLMIPVKVNGVTLSALIDTGSEDTSITKEAATSLGITPELLQGDQVITEEGLGDSSEHLHRFTSITVGGSTYPDPVLAVDEAPSPIQAAISATVLSALPEGHRRIDVILGANYLFKTSVFLDYPMGAVYIR